MSFTIEAGKETGLIQINVTPKPLVLIQIAAVDGDTLYLATTPDLGSTTRLYNGQNWQARLLNNAIEQIQAMSAQGYDIPGSITVEIDDGDFEIWGNHAKTHQWRGGTLTVFYALWDAGSGTYSTNNYQWPFILGKPKWSKGMLSVTAQARQSMTRMTVPNYPNQTRCGHNFPTTAAERLDGLTNPTSPFWMCGYSPDYASLGGIGNTTTANLANSDGTPLTDGSGIYVCCDFTRSCGNRTGTLTQGCMARHGNYSGNPPGGSSPDGNLIQDQSGRATARFAGNTYLAPVGWSGTQYTNPSAGKLYGFNTPNPATGSRYYPQGYGTQWVNAEVLAPFGDPNSDRAECIVCMAPVGQANIIKVLVGGVDVTQDNSDGLFLFRVLSAGGRQGTVSLDADYGGAGDCHGSMCAIEVVVPTQLVQAGQIPQVQVLVQFPQCLHAMPIATAAASGANTILTLPAGDANPDVGNLGTVYVKGNSAIPDGPYSVVPGSGVAGPPGSFAISGISVTGSGGSVFYYPLSIVDSSMIDSLGNSSANPVWALMDLLAIWGPFTVADFDVQSWYDAAQFCATQVVFTDANGNSQVHARYRCSLALTNENRMTLAKAVLGIRNTAGIILRRNPANGLLQCSIERTLADQQPAAIAGSNYNSPVSSVTASGSAANGFLAYLFDGNGSIEKDSLDLDGLDFNDTPNTVSFQFQDSANAWVQDSLTVVDPNGYTASGNQEIADETEMFGIDNFAQGQQRAYVTLAKAMYGNLRGDAGGTELYKLKSTLKAAHLASITGAIVGIRYDQLGL